jgi:hypothetical protein
MINLDALERQRQIDWSMAMAQRQIAYYYNGIIKAEETDLDLDGDIRIPAEGEIVFVRAASNGEWSR